VTPDEVRDSLRKTVLEFAPRLALAVLDRKDYEYQHELAQRIDATVTFLAHFEREVQAHPNIDALVLLKQMEAKFSALAVAERGTKASAPSVWDLIQNPAL
jgi:hypothetical protein